MFTNIARFLYYVNFISGGLLSYPNDIIYTTCKCTSKVHFFCRLVSDTRAFRLTNEEHLEKFPTADLGWY